VVYQVVYGFQSGVDMTTPVEITITSDVLVDDVGNKGIGTTGLESEQTAPVSQIPTEGQIWPR